MQTFRFARLLIASAVLLASCVNRGATQTTVVPLGEASAPSATTQSVTTRVTHGQSLLYISSANGNVYVYTYPQRRPVTTLGGFVQPMGLCADSAGNVFITAYSNGSFTSSTIYEYAHGGTSPIATLSDPGVAFGCAVDPLSGSLAVANVSDNSNPNNPGYGDVAIYPDAQGAPTMYYSSEFEDFWFCGYDHSGNLYLSAFPVDNHGQYDAQLVTLAKGSGTITHIDLNAALQGGPQFEPSVQSDGRHIVVSSEGGSQNDSSGPLFVYRLKISGNKASVIGTTNLISNKNIHGGQSWIENQRIIGFYYYKGNGNVAFWPYPEGGKPSKRIKNIAQRAGGALWGVTVSVLP